MFKAKVTISKNINGKVENIEKEFTDRKSYEVFLRENNVGKDLPGRGPEGHGFGGFFAPHYGAPMFGYVPAPAPHYHQDYGCCDDQWCDCEETVELPVDLDFYEQELAKVEEDKALKAQQKSWLEAALAKLEEYKGKVKGVRDDLLERIDADMKKVKAELKKLEA